MITLGYLKLDCILKTEKSVLSYLEERVFFWIYNILLYQV